MDEWLAIVLLYAIPVIEACGALVIVIEVIRTIIIYLARYFRRAAQNVTRLRTRLARSMVFGLEFQIAADILKTTLDPTWNDLLILAALIALRTLLNFLLERELAALDVDRPLSTGYADQR